MEYSWLPVVLVVVVTSISSPGARDRKACGVDIMGVVGRGFVAGVFAVVLWVIPGGLCIAAGYQTCCLVVRSIWCGWW